MFVTDDPTPFVDRSVIVYWPWRCSIVTLENLVEINPTFARAWTCSGACYAISQHSQACQHTDLKLARKVTKAKVT